MTLFVRFACAFLLLFTVATPVVGADATKMQQVIDLLKSRAGWLDSYCQDDDWFCARFESKKQKYILVHNPDLFQLAIFVSMYELDADKPYGTYIEADADGDGLVDRGYLTIGNPRVVGRGEWEYANGKYCEWRAGLKMCPKHEDENLRQLHQKVFDQALDAFLAFAAEHQNK